MLFEKTMLIFLTLGLLWNIKIIIRDKRLNKREPKICSFIAYIFFNYILLMEISLIISIFFDGDIGKYQVYFKIYGQIGISLFIFAMIFYIFIHSRDNNSCE